MSRLQAACASHAAYPGTREISGVTKDAFKLMMQLKGFVLWLLPCHALSRTPSRMAQQETFGKDDVVTMSRFQTPVGMPEPGEEPVRR